MTLDEGDDITCTITNDDVAPKLTLIKSVINDDGGNAQPDDFSLTVGGNGVLSGVTNTYQANVALALDETQLTGYTFVSITGDPKCPAALGGTVTLDEGDDITCTITNDDIRPQLTVIKTVINDAGGTGVASDWQMDVTATNPDLAFFPGAEAPGTTIGVDAGAYSVDESGGLPGYVKTLSADCSGTIAVGETKTCTITNDDIAPTLTLIKTVINDDGGTLGVSDFPLFISGNAATSGVPVVVSAGSYLASETTQPGYAPSAWGGDCDAAGNVTLSVGENKVCTITNDDIAPKLKLVKSVVSTEDADDWTLTAEADPPDDDRNFSNLGGSGVFKTVYANAEYTLSETGPAGFVATAWSCVDSGGAPVAITTDFDPTDGQIAMVTLALADEVTCTITNVEPGAVTSSSLCAFDTSPKNGSQFNLIFTPDGSLWSGSSNGAYKITSTNPGQFFYNVFHQGAPGDPATFTVSIPYPFVTQGATPWHLYDGVSLGTADGEDCFDPGEAFETHQQLITLADYDTPTTGGDFNCDANFCTYTINTTIPASGFIYLNVHLDYGLKGPQTDAHRDPASGSPDRYGQGSCDYYDNGTPGDPSDDILVGCDAAEVDNSGNVLIDNCTPYTFSHTGDSAFSFDVENANIFKRIRGAFGSFWEGDALAGSPLGFAAVQLIDQDGVTVETGATDEDGYYGMLYKHTGKKAPYTVYLPDFSYGHEVMLKANGYAEVNFTMDGGGTISSESVDNSSPGGGGGGGGGGPKPKTRGDDTTGTTGTLPQPTGSTVKPEPVETVEVSPEVARLDSAPAIEEPAEMVVPEQVEVEPVALPEPEVERVAEASVPESPPVTDSVFYPSIEPQRSPQEPTEAPAIAASDLVLDLAAERDTLVGSVTISGTAGESGNAAAVSELAYAVSYRLPGGEDWLTVGADCVSDPALPFVLEASDEATRPSTVVGFACVLSEVLPEGAEIRLRAEALAEGETEAVGMTVGGRF